MVGLEVSLMSIHGRNELQFVDKEMASLGSHLVLPSDAVCHRDGHPPAGQKTSGLDPTPHPTRECSQPRPWAAMVRYSPDQPRSSRGKGDRLGRYQATLCGTRQGNHQSVVPKSVGDPDRHANRGSAVLHTASIRLGGEPSRRIFLFSVREMGRFSPQWHRSVHSVALRPMALVPPSPQPKEKKRVIHPFGIFSHQTMILI